MVKEKVLFDFIKRTFPEPILELARFSRRIWWVITFRHIRLTRQAVGEVTPYWRKRIDDVKMCPDNAFIPRHQDAGRLRRGRMIMHNGIRVDALGYYGAGILNMLIENRGVHEPQEERVFRDVLTTLPQRSTMIEAGAYWGFYSLWFASVIPFAKCYLIEPSHSKLQVGIQNFKRNGCDADTLQAYVGCSPGIWKNGVPIITIDDYCKEKRINFVTILHADIQGAEFEMLEGAGSMLASGKIGYVFISSHSSKLHYQCMDYLRSNDYDILASADLGETYSVDGLLVACSNRLSSTLTIEISKR